MNEQGLDPVSDDGVNVIRVPQKLPGECLREAREAIGLSVDDVAQTLKFSPRQIEALERDDFQALQGATFLRGFVRSYARLLKLDAAPLLSQIEAEAAPAAAEITPPCNMGEAAPVSFFERNQRWLIAALLLIVVAVVGGYFYTRMDFVVSANSSTSALGSQPVPTEGVVPVVVEPPKATPVTPSEPVVAEAAAPEGPRVPADVSATTPAITAHTLVFDFDDVSWLEVKDASQRIVLTGEFPKGTRQVVNGRPPFQLWIGKAAGVRLVYGERKVDLQPYTRDAVARLTLD